MATKQFLVHIWGDIQPNITGPFDEGCAILEKAIAIRENELGGLYRLFVNDDGSVEMESFANDELPEEN